MKHKKYTIQRVIISILVGLFGLTIQPYLVDFIDNESLANLLLISFISLIIIFTNYNLFYLHLKRSKINKVFFTHTLLITIFSLLVIIFSIKFSTPFLPVIDEYIATKYQLLVPISILTFSYAYIITYTLIYKILTDKIKTKNVGFGTILITSILYSTLFCAFLPNIETNYVNNLILYMPLAFIISLSYNFCNSLFTGIFSVSNALIIYNLILLFSF